jgi:uncharacterized protein YdeI (YjbR/CyaY-like superfamily)
MANDVLFFATPKDFRTWLKANHGRVDVQWVGYRKVGTGKPSITWQESVDEALCYGWIDGLRHKIDEQAYKIRFTPRREGSVWSAKNIASAEQLIAEGRMRAPGLRAYERRREDKSSIYSYEQRKDLELAGEYLEEFRKSKAAWRYYRARPPGYRRQTAHWVMSAKKEETRRRRLRQLIECSAEERPIPQLERSPK